MSTEGVRVYFCTETGLIDAVRWHGDYGCCHDITDQLAKRDEDIARRAFEAGAKRKEINETVHWEEAQRRGFRFLAGDERETVEFFVRTQTATDYINSEEFKKR